MATVALIVFVGLVPMIVGICLIATSRRTGTPEARCGNCGYNLTGATSNRCPEGGELFIEAGVATDPVTSRTNRRWFGIALVLLPLIPTTFGFATTMYYRAKTARPAAAVVIKRGAKLELSARNRLDESFSASPAVAGNELDLRGERNLYCIAEGTAE